MGRGVNRLYPQRQRCYKCHNFFGPLVVRGLYCSYTCAGHEVPRLGAEPSPRDRMRRACFNRNGKPKRSFMSAQEARDLIASELKDPLLEVYLCWRCQTWHLGHGSGT